MAHYKSNSDIGNSQSMRFSDFDPSGPMDEGLDHHIMGLSLERNALNSEAQKLEDRVEFLEAKIETMRIAHQSAREMHRYEKNDFIAKIEESQKLTDEIQRVNHELSTQLSDTKNLYADGGENKEDKDKIIASLEEKLAAEKQLNNNIFESFEKVAGRTRSDYANAQGECAKLRSYLDAAKHDKAMNLSYIERLEIDKVRSETALKAEKAAHQQVVDSLKEEMSDMDLHIDTLNAEKEASEARNDLLCAEIRNLAGTFHRGLDRIEERSGPLEAKFGVSEEKLGAVEESVGALKAKVLKVAAEIIGNN